MKRIISPSMLSADFGNLERDTRMIDTSAAEWVHIDVMDGVFVPNISFGFVVMKPIRRATNKCLDVHLMIINPEKYVEEFVKEGADIVTIHYEADCDVVECLKLIRKAGAKAGVSIKPGTEVDVLEGLLPYVDLILVMSVEPGFGGQSFMPNSLDKVRALRVMIDRAGLDIMVEVDGGVSTQNARELFDAGAEALVAGSSVFGAKDPQAEIVKMLEV